MTSSAIKKLPSIRLLPLLATRRLSGSRLQRHASKGEATTGKDTSEQGDTFATLIAKQTVAMFASGAVLGPLCDAQHSRYGVLKYAGPVSIPLPHLGYTLETCWWVPLLFGLAGVILGVGYPLLDLVLLDSDSNSTPTWPVVTLGITVFVLQYWASGLFSESASTLQLSAFLSGVAVLQMTIFDHTRTGLALSLLTAICGPVIEILLISKSLYAYSHPDIAGVPFWIPAVYFAGGPAVGNLGRLVWLRLQSSK